jgi:hypothetical protein
MGPYATLAKQYPDIQITQGGQNTLDYQWNTLRKYDILIVQRPSIPVHAQIVMQAQMLGLPVVVDYDDDLTSVPKDNPTYSIYAAPENKEAMIKSIQNATIVTVSTEHLKSKINLLNDNIVVIPNALDDACLKRRPFQKKENGKKTILWRGSNTHVGDILAYRDQILKVYETHKAEWQWYFLGADPWMLIERMEPGTYGTAPFADHLRYFNLLQNIQAEIQIVPLADNSFNRSKSNCAWLEGTLAHSAIVGPEFDEWKRPGITNVNPETFIDAMNKLIASEEIRLNCVTESWNYIESNLKLTDINTIRYNLIRGLVKS